jgi:1,4-alpha-glucan branching enzyme/maltooligosyltrehalose trehalohydrolase
MPFGAQLTRAGHVRFRLWAPAALRVEVLLGEGESARALPMLALEDGFFELQTDEAGPGSYYRFRIDGGLAVADPASRYNPQGVHGPSVVIDPGHFRWDDGEWRAPPWPTSVLYELHVGTFTPGGTFAAAIERLDYLVELGVTAIELMPVGAFPGRRDWGYDGVLPYAPQASYGTPEELKALIARAHRVGLGVVLDVIYNHFGPEGNYLHHYAPQFFTDRYSTPWGTAINFDGPQSATVRDFFIHNALYWLEEYHLDGLRLDAVHAIHDAGSPHILRDIAHAVRAGPGAERPVYLVLENLDNAARLLGGAHEAHCYDAQWNDDAHHCLHVLLTGERDGYYADFAQEPLSLLCRSLAEGFAYQGEHSAFTGRGRGERSAQLPPSAFINFLQNHDQVGNRTCGERLASLVSEPAALRAAVALLLLAPEPPLLFMGEEWAATEPFAWFCDFEPDLAARILAARRGERPGCPDPGAEATFARARLDWRVREREPHAQMLRHYRELLALRHLEIDPLIALVRGGRCVRGTHPLVVEWPCGERTLRLIANLSAAPATVLERAAGRVLYASHPQSAAAAPGTLPPWSVLWLLEER